jgi:hypothetical protein
MCGYRPKGDPRWDKDSMDKHMFVHLCLCPLNLDSLKGWPTPTENEQNNKGWNNTDENAPSRLWNVASSSHGYTGSGSLPRSTVHAVTAQTDSGYASLAREKEVGPHHSHQDPVTMAPEEAMGEDKPSDIETIYSDDRSQASLSRTQRYISEFVDHLFGKIKHQAQNCKEARIKDCLPELLQAFALKVGQAPSTRGHLEVMYFVHKHRRYVRVSLIRKSPDQHMLY